MKKKFLNTKNVVIGLVSLVLIGASATGVAVFLKDRGEAAAAEQEQVQNLPATGRGEDNNQTGENTTIPSENNTTGDNTQIPTEPSTTEGTTPGETTRPGATGTTTRPRTEEAVAGIEETVRIEERKVFEDLKLSWTTLAIPAITVDMGIFKPVLGIEKTATAVVRANQEEQIPVTENNVPMVRAGDTIIYTIKVSNSGNYKATNVVVTDSLDVIFDGQTVKANEELAKIETLDAGKQATLKVGYVVTQDDIDDLTNTMIINRVVATDGKTTVEDEDTSIEKEQIEDYEIYKTSTLNKKDGNKDEKAEVGDTITYTITVKNTGTVTLENLNVIDRMVKLNETITLKPRDKKVFEKDYEITASDIAKALDNDSKIKNTAVVEYKDNEDKPGKNEEDVKTSYNLTINYVYENGETASETYTDTLNYLASYNVTSPEITGYKTETTVVEGEMPAHDVTVTVVYVKDATQTNKLTYTVNHIIVNGNEKTTVETNSFEENVYVLDEQKITVKSGSLTISNASKITGYKLDAASSSTVKEGDKVADKTEINFYYVKDSFSYTVEYYYDGVKDDNKTEKDTAEYDSIITTYDDKVITGYVLEKVTPVDDNNNVSLRITENADNNVIRVYYVKDNFDYTVEYYQDTISETNKLGETDKISKPYGTVLTEEIVSQDLKDENWINAEKPTGYKDGEVQGYITINTANNVIKVLYEKRTDLRYTIEYYYQSLDNEAEYNHDENENSIVDKVAYQTEIKLEDIEEYKNKHEIEGYVFDKNKTEEEGTLPLKVSTDESENVIKLYYKRNSFKYTVKHYTEKLDGTWEYKEKDEYANVKFGTPATYNSKGYQGFTFDDSKTENKNETVPANNDLVIKLYYTRNTYNYTVNFFIEGENEPFETYTKSAKMGETITVSKEEISNTNKDPEIYEYKPGNTSVVIKEGKNVINIYYKEIIKVANITETSTAIRKTNLVLVLDLSSSMEDGTTRLADAKTATKNFIDQIYSSSAVSGVNIKVITFNTRNPIKEYKGITKCENEEHWEYWLFGIPVHKDETDCKNINGEWYSEYEEWFAAYSGTQVLSVSGLTNNTVTNYAEAQNLKTAIDSIYIPDKYKNGGYGTHIYAALQKANTELTALGKAYGENDNVLVFLSDGKPTEPDNEEYSDNTVDNIASEASNITATKYCIRFGKEAQNSTVFNKIATDNSHIIDATTGGDLISGFNAINDEEKENKFTRSSESGIISITNVDLDISTEKPLTVTKPDGTVATYTSIEEINASEFVEYAEKTIVWDVRKYSKEATLNMSYNIK